ncbi:MULTISPECIES: hypothetical protein [unclassified Paenibacillus]|uniref:Uncharacterized protein n=1 Tax=Paenibacillus provencensis TaxID=441151 RepID=A0ABW3PVJ8_9BACL|nr:MULTISPECIES: hypothetical protein [unclassified Paenibacillus]MCM3130609.1 hypothetical protein [Paenibacillus sp. MER 78]SDX74572.1 hypothetical protein SAMN05518848_11363 [Paenibacillus sp. PDC88]SFS89881.1 hypothetical protein SAMN04488601_106183 [Paenibacillus sp. 453mf]
MIDKEYYLKLSKDAQKNYAFYKEEAEAAAVRREFTSNKRYDITPFWYGRESTVPGEVSEVETDIYYEFDSQNRPLISANDELIDGYTYSVYEENRITTRLYLTGELYSIKEYLIKDGFINRCVEYSPRFDKLQYEDYIYEGGNLVQVYQPVYENSPYYSSLVRTYLEYDKKGELTRVLDGDKGVIFVRMSTDEAALLREEVKEELKLALIEVVDAVCKGLVDIRCCFLAIYLHDEAHGVYSPIFHPGLQHIRDEQIENNKDFWTIWASGEHPVNYQQEISDQELITKLRTLIMYWHNTDTWWEEGMKLWHEVTYAINATVWSKYPLLSELLSEDFVLFVDWEGLDVTKGELEKSIPLSKRKMLKSKGLLPV